MPMWFDVLAAVSLIVLLFVVVAYAYRLWRIVRHNETFEAGGSMGDQIIGPRDGD